MREPHPNRPLPHFRGILRLLRHGYILSRVGASGKDGAVQNLKLKIDAGVATRQIAYLTVFVVVPAALDMAIDPAGRFLSAVPASPPAPAGH